jgi:hypothetical protein
MNRASYNPKPAVADPEAIDASSQLGDDIPTSPTFLGVAKRVKRLEVCFDIHAHTIGPWLTTDFSRDGRGFTRDGVSYCNNSITSKIF